MFHRRRMVAPINSVKHYVQHTNTSIASAARTQLVVINTVVAPAVGTSADVREGAIVKAVYFEHWIKGTGAADADTQFIVVLEKLPGASTAGITAAQMLNIGSYDNKKNIFFTGQGVIGGVGGGQAIPFLRGWIKIPKSKQRFGAGDTLLLNISTVGEAMQHCGFETYKEYV